VNEAISLSIDKATFVVVDVETTGMSPLTDRVTEIAMMKVRNGHLVDEFSTLINPLITIPAHITALTGIDNITVADAPPAREVARTIATFLGDSIFVAHNVAFDWGFVRQTLLREREIDLQMPLLCTVKLSRKLLPSLPSHSLGVVAQALDIKIHERHRASGDAYATALALITFLTHLKNQRGLKTVDEVLKYQRGGEKRPRSSKILSGNRRVG
jgi:DNA polymerase-3 subunit epsilon